DFCSRILPLIQAKRPGLKLLIVGADPSSAVLRLGTIRGVTVTGSVADVRPFLRRAAVMVAPLNIARGTQNKILEAMALGVPVVTSTLAAGGAEAPPPLRFSRPRHATRDRDCRAAHSRRPQRARAPCPCRPCPHAVASFLGTL